MNSRVTGKQKHKFKIHFFNPVTREVTLTGTYRTKPCTEEELTKIILKELEAHKYSIVERLER